MVLDAENQEKSLEPEVLDQCEGASRDRYPAERKWCESGLVYSLREWLECSAWRSRLGVDL